MSTSAPDARRRAAKNALVYLIVAIFCAALGAVYELFSHEVYSYFMLYAFAFPFCGGTFPYLLFSLSPQMQMPGEYDRLTGHLGIATLTTGSIMTGVLEIYGTTNLLTRLYWATGILLYLGFMFQVSRNCISSGVRHR